MTLEEICDELILRKKWLDDATEEYEWQKAMAEKESNIFAENVKSGTIEDRFRIMR